MWRAALALAVCAGCGAHHRYESGAARSSVDPPPSQLVDVLDARVGGTARASPSPGSERELAEVREAVRAHAHALGVVTAHRPAFPAPVDAAELDSILRDGADRGLAELVFVRLHTASVYLSAAVSAFEVLAVDPVTRELLFSQAALITHRQQAGPFDDQSAILHDTMRRAIAGLFDLLMASRAAGHPRRGRTAALAVRVLSRPLAQVVAGRVVGLRWSFDALEGWALTGGLGGSTAGIRAPDGTYVSVVMEPAFQAPEAYGGSVVATLREIATVAAERPCVVDGRACLDVEARYANGLWAIHRVTSEDGLGLVFSCVGSEAQLAEHRAECARALGSVRLVAGSP